MDENQFTQIVEKLDHLIYEVDVLKSTISGISDALETIDKKLKEFEEL
jgi:hypothetical protein